MKTIKGICIKKRNFDKFKKVADLIYFDGPLLSHYVTNKGDNYLFYWIDQDVYLWEFDSLIPNQKDIRTLRMSFFVLFFCSQRKPKRAIQQTLYRSFYVNGN